MIRRDQNKAAVREVWKKFPKRSTTELSGEGEEVKEMRRGREEGLGMGRTKHQHVAPAGLWA